ncbi:MAG: hypothetical protein P1U39_03675 [Legionellaceae bacterium]|nr:hypothetical protein [Legionellaceae bacterium]
MRYLRLFVLLTLVFAASRGIFIYHLGWSPAVTYPVTSMAIIFSGMLSLYFMSYDNNKRELIWLFNMVKVNALVQLFYFFTTYLISSTIEVSSLYMALGFPIIFFIMKLKEDTLELALLSIVIITITGINIIHSLSEYSEIVSAREILRPTAEGVGRIGEYFLAFGYQGDHHDAANILMFTAPLFLVSALYKPQQSLLKKMVLFITIGFSIQALLLTGSASNISICLCMLIIVSWANKNVRMFIMVLVSVVLLLNSKELGVNSFFLSKFSGHNDLATGGMFNSLDLVSILTSMHSILFGFGYHFNVPMVHSEVAFVKLLISIGLFGFIVLSFILFSPIYYMRKIQIIIKEMKRNTVAYNNLLVTEYTYVMGIALACLSGTLSLVHYGSLFRITSICPFVCLLALFFKKYLELSFNLPSYVAEPSEFSQGVSR